MHSDLVCSFILAAILSCFPALITTVPMVTCTASCDSLDSPGGILKVRECLLPDLRAGKLHRVGHVSILKKTTTTFYTPWNDCYWATDGLYWKVFRKKCIIHSSSHYSTVSWNIHVKHYTEQVSSYPPHIRMEVHPSHIRMHKYLDAQQYSQVVLVHTFHANVYKKVRLWTINLISKKVLNVSIKGWIFVLIKNLCEW